jgi:hypothetical protein
VDPPELAPTAFVDIPIPDVTDADWFSYFGGGYGDGSDAGFGGASAYPQVGPHVGEVSVMRTSLRLIQPLHLQPHFLMFHNSKDLSQELVHAN